MLKQHLLLIVRGQDELTLEQYLALTALFGEVNPSLSTDTAHPESRFVQVVERTPTPGSLLGHRLSSTYYWHTDRSFLSVPPAVSILHQRILPRSGGSTLFANCVNAYNATLDRGFGELNYRAIHSYAAYFRDLQSGHFTPNQVKAASLRFPDVTHPLVRVDRVSNQRALNLSELCLTSLVGMPDKDGRLLLDALYEIATRRENIYVHHWRQGDLLIWHNFGIMHRGTPCAGPRVLHRTVCGAL